MAMTKPHGDARAKKSVATNAMFKKVGKEALRQTSRHMKGTFERTTKVSKSDKSKHKAKHIPEHTLATDFAGKIRLI